MKIDIRKISPLTGEPDFDVINTMFGQARGRIEAHINSRFHGAAISTGRRVARSMRLLGVNPSARVVDTSLIDEKILTRA